MQVVRWRKNNSGVSSGVNESDITRTQIAQDFLAATIKQCLQIQNVTKVKELANIFTEYVDTELTVGELVWFAEQALVGGLSAEDMYLCTMPYEGAYVYSRTVGNLQSYVVPDSDELIQTVNQYFNPYLELVSLENLDHMRANSDGSVSSSTGIVRDTQATYPTSHWTPPEPEPTQTEEPEPTNTVPDEPPVQTDALPGETEPAETTPPPGDDLPMESGQPPEESAPTDTAAQPTPSEVPPQESKTPPSSETSFEEGGSEPLEFQPSEEAVLTPPGNAGPEANE